MSEVILERVEKRFGGFTAVHALDLHIEAGEFVALLGPSGCGKTTTLRMLAGLDFPTSGDIRIGTRSVKDVAPGKRDIAMVFQSYALYPHMTVEQNIGYPLRKRGVRAAERGPMVARAADLLQLGALMKRKPRQLSGGQQQRVALGRALVRDPQVFLLDEPLSNLDAKLRAYMRAELVELHRRLGRTMVYVTHDQLEAMTMADRIAVMSAGRLQQFGTHDEVYNRPDNRFVAEFIGTPSMNLADGQITARGFALPLAPAAFDSTGAIDFDAHARNVERQLAAGATGFVVAGCTGEFWALAHSERKDLVRETAGADAILVLPPYFVHATDDELTAHFTAVDRGTALPMVLYNIPGNAGNALTPALVDRLADLDKVVAIKESSGDWGNFHRTLLAVRDRIRVFCGPSSVFGVAAVEAGADGLIDCFPNVWTDCLDLWSAARAGDTVRAAALQATGIALTDLFVSGGRTLYPATKAAMDYLGYAGGGTPRPPLLPLSGPPLDELRSGLDALLGQPALAQQAE